jgi:ribosomal protein S18 acetylase RimI-like enzyme
MTAPITIPSLGISTLSPDEAEAHLAELAALLHACVHDGASIGFVLPFTMHDATTFWAKSVLPQVRAGTRVLLVARENGVLAGSVQLDHDTPPNQPHRAEVRKLIVHPDFRRRGIARALMAELEAIAAMIGRSLITLDTRTGDAAEPLYASLGYATAGVIPGYARDPAGTRLDATTVMYKGT